MDVGGYHILMSVLFPYLSSCCGKEGKVEARRNTLNKNLGSTEIESR